MGGGEPLPKSYFFMHWSKLPFLSFITNTNKLSVKDKLLLSYCPTLLPPNSPENLLPTSHKKAISISLSKIKTQTIRP